MMDLGTALLLTGIAIVVAVGYVRIVIGDNRSGDVCFECGESAVFKQRGDYCCLACGAFQNYELETD